ncbi:2,3-bisphosphoglycerate-independent phosphoglycerate mutase [Pelotomaculum sp. PtaB.Bin117]|uniref:2,3-bisphosphoglycerate-independent phosphoglycerate mutase n=1 Tax=Pelotomaculum sp. PtaB.Bin117 TaxID=1811694 RepID=UPI0009D418AB|nr:2,3-bisphosphoglycerate-independent phosphoglycerate mutase [Pelotomaculum sp. PtaB.Bin117]OPX89723.1 MAG: 2,3-bisphosphoglycerate-independent phosphoglycerate mutase [Pelotomaculum sp. PtaB.Bin117]
MKTNKKPLVLVIMDGWGLSSRVEGNAIARANTPNVDSCLANYPHCALVCSGEEVGLPEGQMGNSEVGHLNIGAGRVVYQEFTRINRAVRDKSFFENKILLESVKHVKKNGSALHLMGLLSDGGVHSHINHLFALLELAARENLNQVFVHAFLDGRDVPPANAKEYFTLLEAKFVELGFGAVATVMGRYYAMDRDRRWERVEQAYNAMVCGDGIQANSPFDAVDLGYGRGETDEFIRPTVIAREGGKLVAGVSDGDAIIFYNFRPDRARELTRAFIDEDFDGFARRDGYPKVHFTCMTLYDKTIKAPVAFEPQRLGNTLGQVFSDNGIVQLRLAETEKYAHVTFFFNGGVEAPNPGEERILIPSPKVATYDLKPEMSAVEVTDTFLEQLNTGKFDVIIMNYANADMVGHTGVMDAAVSAVETVDRCLGRVIPAVLEKNGTVLITADHGNADEMIDENGEVFTAHTTNPVPFLMIRRDATGVFLRDGSLEDIAPTMLELLNIPKPREMTGKSLMQNASTIK